MFAIEVELLTGCYTATRYDDRNKPEWPPHPARLYSALVNAWAESDDHDDGEQQALRWFESLTDPEVASSRLTADTATSEVAVRSVVTHYVPDNDPTVVRRDLHRTYEQLQRAADATNSHDQGPMSKVAERTSKELTKALDKAESDSLKAAASGTAPDSALAVLPDLRGKQPRTYPTVRPADPVVTYTWPEHTPDDATHTHLDALLSRVGRLGHSSSLVSCRVIDEKRTGTYVPRADGETLIRLPGPGQFDRLRELHEFHQGSEPRSLPKRIVRYGSPRDREPPYAGSVWHNGTFIALTLADGPRLSVRDSLALAQAVRGAILAHAGEVAEAIPESISGHVPREGSEASTTRSQRPHMAVVPLPFAGFRHADGLIKGVAVLLPEVCSEPDRNLLFRAINHWLDDEDDDGHLSGELWARGQARTWTVRHEPGIDRPRSLHFERWADPSRRWATVTPTVLDRYPDALWRGSSARRARGHAQAVTLIGQACEAIGLTVPRRVEVRADAPVEGAQPVRRHPTFHNGARQEPRPSVHAVIEFDEPVAGPVMIGRGRYLGQGLCAPLGESR